MSSSSRFFPPILVAALILCVGNIGLSTQSFVLYQIYKLKHPFRCFTGFLINAKIKFCDGWIWVKTLELHEKEIEKVSHRVSDVINVGSTTRELEVSRLALILLLKWV
ncbi:uncharacterized protein LOC124425866 isoform X2 [Vespa crabro]|uniref:uncharacterized protein LOC124425866 isoform X2 n=1 Tax=Vespa crabro TaxID=7445 RepID=UPI001EFFF169|nr:uncharacterized protein LOC124425866 isoform X2 [Vespa crabro]